MGRVYLATELATKRPKDLGAPSLPAGFDAWFARAVAREPESRFPDAGAAHRALVEVFEAPARRRRVALVAGALVVLAAIAAVVATR